MVLNNAWDSEAVVRSYLTNEGYDQFHNYIGAPSPDVWSHYGFTGGIPTNALFDKDGYVRRAGPGALVDDTEWPKTIAECTGAV